MSRIQPCPASFNSPATIEHFKFPNLFCLCGFNCQPICFSYLVINLNLIRRCPYPRELNSVLSHLDLGEVRPNES